MDLINLLKQEKTAGKVGKLAFPLIRMDLVILDALGKASERTQRGRLREFGNHDRATPDVALEPSNRLTNLLGHE